MLVVEVPERRLLQHSEDVGHLEEHHRLVRGSKDRPHVAHEPAHLVDVLEGVPTHDGVRGEIGIGGGGPAIDDEPQTFVVGRDPPRHERRVEAGAAVVARGTDQREELALPATDLDDVLAPEPVTLDPSGRERLGEGPEPRGEALGLLVALRVGRQLGLEGLVRDEPAARAPRQAQVARGEGKGLGPVVEQDAAADRDPLLLVEHLEVPASTGETRVSNGHASTFGSGNGTMNRPPNSVEADCWRRISRSKFHASSTT